MVELRHLSHIGLSQSIKKVIEKTLFFPITQYIEFPTVCLLLTLYKCISPFFIQGFKCHKNNQIKMRYKYLTLFLHYLCVVYT